MMEAVLPALVLLLAQRLLMASAAAALPGCLSSCGKVDVPYPFGIGINCSIRESFEFACIKMADGSEKPFQGDVEILNISLLQGQLRLLNQISYRCSDPTDMSILQDAWYFGLPDGYRFSYTKNIFIVIGCSTLAFIGDGNTGLQGNATSYQSGCVATCPSLNSLNDSSCVGAGCCHTTIPKDLAYNQVWFEPVFNTTVNSYRNCSYAVLMETASFQFQTSYLTTGDFLKNNGTVPVVLDWVVGEETCAEAKLNASSYACKSENSECVDSTNGPGYLCNCSSGYAGNPYLPNGCQDDSVCGGDPNPCTAGICRNLPGNYECFDPQDQISISIQIIGS